MANNRGIPTRLFSSEGELDSFFNPDPHAEANRITLFLNPNGTPSINNVNALPVDIVSHFTPSGYFNIKIERHDAVKPYTHTRNECVIIHASKFNIHLDSLMNHIIEDSPCKVVPGYIYLNLLLCISKSYVRYIAEAKLAGEQWLIDADVKCINLTDAAHKHVKFNNKTVSDKKHLLSAMTWLDKGRFYYEGYGFLPNFNLLGKVGHDLDHPQYINILNKYLNDRHLLLTTPINKLHTLNPTDLFLYEGFKLIRYMITDGRIGTLTYKIIKFIEMVNTTPEYAANGQINDNMSIKMIYEVIKYKKCVIELIEFITSLIVNNILPDESYYPITTNDNKKIILNLYTQTYDIELKRNYFMFICSDRLYYKSGNDNLLSTVNNSNVNRRRRRTLKKRMFNIRDNSNNLLLPFTNAEYGGFDNSIQSGLLELSAVDPLSNLHITQADLDAMLGTFNEQPIQNTRPGGGKMTPEIPKANPKNKKKQSPYTRPGSRKRPRP
jgi:hypothetical protein